MNKKLLFVVLVCGLAILLSTFIAAAQKSSRIDPANFVNGIDNRFFPLRPGTTFYYVGTKDGVPTTNVTFVTHQTKRILGVRTTVVLDRAYDNGILAEDTLDWYAQDAQGNVMYFGEDTKELDANGNVISTEGTWMAGVNGAQPGIIMEANPAVHDRYQQEFAAGVAEDMALVLSLDESACVIYGCFDNLLLTKEWAHIDPGTSEVKYYAENVGFVLGNATRHGNEHTELVNITTPYRT
jgi:hypothetical protein